MNIELGRVYDPPAAGTTRVLVDRLWPRGIRKESAPWDLWVKEVAPSGALRKWYHAHPDAIEEFRGRYRQELLSTEQKAALGRLWALALAQAGRLVLLTATRDVHRSQVPVLRETLLAMSEPQASGEGASRGR